MNLSLLIAIPVFLVTLGQSPAASGQSGGHGDGHTHWQAPSKEANRKNPAPADSASIDRGKKLYKTHCASCHGEQGKGDGPAGVGLKPRPTDLTHMAGHHRDGDLAWKIATGRGAMPGWNGVLTDAEIWDLVNFMKSF